MSLHWLTRYDPEDGEPYGQTCACEIGVDHDGDGNLTDPEPADVRDTLAALDWTTPQEQP